MIQSSPLSTLVLDEHSRILFANPAFIEFAGRSSDHLIGQEIGKVLQCGEFYKNDENAFGKEECLSCSLCNLHERTAAADYFEEDIHIHQLFGLIDADLHLLATPFSWGEHRFTLLFLKDIRHEKRSLSFEKFIDQDIQKDLLRIREWMNELDYPSDIDREALSRRIRLTLNTLLKSIQTDHMIRDAEKNQLIPETNEFSIRTLFTDVYENLEHLLEQNGCMLSLNLPANLSPIKTDRHLMEIILTHLLKNGLDSARENDTLQLRVEESENTFDFYINNPQFIPEDIQAHLFTPHFSTREKRVLGPYRIKLIIERILEGSVQCESTESRGTRFRIQIPKCARKTAAGKTIHPS